MKKGQFYLLAAVLLVSLSFIILMLARKSTFTTNIDSFNELKDNYLSESSETINNILYEKNKNNGTSVEYLYRAIELAKESKDKSILDDSINTILDKAILTNDPVEMEKVRGEILELLNLKLLMPNSKLLMKLIGYYMSKEKYDKVNGIIKFCSDKVS